MLDSLQEELATPSLYQEEILSSQLKTLLLACSKIKLRKVSEFSGFIRGAVCYRTPSPILRRFALDSLKGPKHCHQKRMGQDCQ